MRLNKKQWLLMQTVALLLVVGGVFLVKPHLARAANVNPTLVGDPMSGFGVSGDPYVVTTCEQLQDIGNDDYTYYILANNIDCSATSGWNSGAGFIPIGSNGHFTGELDGHGHTISNVTINYTDDEGNTGLFAHTDNAAIKNFSIANASITGNGNSLNNSAGTGGIIGAAQATYVDKVSFNGSITHTDCSGSPGVGGIIGHISAYTSEVALSRVSTRGTITINGTNCGAYNAAVGGIVGLSNTDNDHAFNIYNSYSTMDITLNGNQQNPCTDGHCRAVGGLIGALSGYAPSLLYDGYSAGSITITDSGNQLEYNVGGIVGNQYAPINLGPAFNAMTINLPNTCEIDTCNSNARHYGALIGGNGVGDDNIVSNFWYDAGLAPSDSCFNNSTSDICKAYNVDNADPDYMKGNSTKSVLSLFDFSTIWRVVTDDYPALIDSQPPYANAVSDLSANILSETTIELNWTPVNSPSEIFDYTVICKRSDEAVWRFCKGDIEPDATSTEITGLSASSSYDFRITTRSTDGGYVGEASNIATATTATPGFILVSSCEDLQNIQNNLAAYYQLSRNIDCSDTISWNGGSGFDPIGSLDYTDFSNLQLFSGIFKGNNYTISNLYSDQTGGTQTCSLFSVAASNFIIQDVKINNLTCLGNLASSSLLGVAAGPGTITNVHVTNSFIGGPNALAVGGLVGTSQNFDPSYTPLELTKSSFEGTVTADNPAYIGGMIAAVVGYANIQDNYSNATITAQAVTMSGGFSGAIVATNDTVVKHNYATGSLDVTSSDASLNTPDPNDIFPDTVSLQGGFSGVIYMIQSNDFLFTENFAHIALSNQSPENVPGGFTGLMTGESATPPSNFDNFYDADLAGTNDCVNLGSPVQVNCTGISGQPNYFKNNSTNPPLNAWDFTTVWMTTNELPIFGTRVTSGISTTPTRTSNGTNGCLTLFGVTKCQSVTPTVTPTSPAGVSQAVATASVTNGKTGGSTTATATTPADEVGVLGAFKHFVRNLPAGVVVAFPYALFGLLLLAALVLLIELIRELRRLHLLQILIHKQQLLAEERDAFWHLAANYLRAPVTLIVGGAEALRESHVVESTTAIATLAASLQNKVAQIMAKIEGSTSLQAISQVQRRQSQQIARRAIFIVPVAIVAFLAVLGNYAASSYRNLGPSALGYATQLVGFIIAVVLFYWVLGLLTQGKSKRKAAQDLLDRQTNELANARHDLIAETAGSLNPDLTKLEGMLHSLPASMATTAGGALTTLGEGTSRLRGIVSSFAMLIKVQEGVGGVSATPEASTIDLTNILSRTRAKLTPQIAAKGVRVMAPAVPLAVHAEAELANQVLESIIANAVDYSPNNGTVKVEAQRLQDAIQIKVSDQGQGIDKKQLDHLFQPFVRADGKSAMDMSHGGFGINLYLDKLIMEQLGGSISASSTPGSGTAITMTWPA